MFSASISLALAGSPAVRATFWSNSLKLLVRAMVDEEMSSLNKGTMSVHTSKKQLSAPLQTIALLTDAILNDMTMRQSEVVYYKLLGFKEADIAKKLGISQASVNNASTATKWYCIEESIKYFEQINFEGYE